tara:strand:+ start:47672 stop:47842 length:171 start_codon:yes stop_codon:yes gene_type:complete
MVSNFNFVPFPVFERSTSINWLKIISYFLCYAIAISSWRSVSKLFSGIETLFAFSS